MKHFHKIYHDQVDEKTKIDPKNSTMTGWISVFVSKSFQTARMTATATKDILSLTTILLTIHRIPKTVDRLVQYRKDLHDRQRREMEWHSKPTDRSFLDLPSEIQHLMMERMDNRTVCRLGQTNHRAFSIAMDHTFWVKRMATDWPDYTSKTMEQRIQRANTLSLNYYTNYKGSIFCGARLALSKPFYDQIESSPGYKFYRQRYITYSKYEFLLFETMIDSLMNGRHFLKR
jgi:hypothetical protein